MIKLLYSYILNGCWQRVFNGRSSTHRKIFPMKDILKPFHHQRKHIPTISSLPFYERTIIRSKHRKMEWAELVRGFESNAEFVLEFCI